MAVLFNGLILNGFAADDCSVDGCAADDFSVDGCAWDECPLI